MIDDQKPPLDEALLIHYGVKGMKWGVRNSEEGGVHRLQGSGPVIDSTLHGSTKTAGKDVSAFMAERYGFHVSAINAIKPDNPEYERGTIGYVQSTPGQRGGVIYASAFDHSKQLKDAEDLGWFGEGCGHARGFLTHEASHALFHAEQSVRPGLFGPKYSGGNSKERDRALQASMKAAKTDGISPMQFASKVSGYAAASMVREEVEAELFTQYHWNPNPPRFVQVWGETLHQEMGIDATPFREEGVKRG